MALQHGSLLCNTERNVGKGERQALLLRLLLRRRRDRLMIQTITCRLRHALCETPVRRRRR
tara:strand:+ start:110 stop:292 length:183 start_codon:yes stop_codon:yes gene_type:complete